MLRLPVIRCFIIEKKCVVTSFKYDALVAMKSASPKLKLGYLTADVTDDILENMKRDGIDEICPKAGNISADDVWKWQKMGFNVRAWGVSDEAVMKKAYEDGVNGMTCNFPDKLVELVKG